MFDVFELTNATSKLSSSVTRRQRCAPNPGLPCLEFWDENRSRDRNIRSDTGQFLRLTEALGSASRLAITVTVERHYDVTDETILKITPRPASGSGKSATTFALILDARRGLSFVYKHTAAGGGQVSTRWVRFGSDSAGPVHPDTWRRYALVLSRTRAELFLDCKTLGSQQLHVPFYTFFSGVDDELVLAEAYNYPYYRPLAADGQPEFLDFSVRLFPN